MRVSVLVGEWESLAGHGVAVGVDTSEFQAILPSSSSQSGSQFRSHHHTSCVTLASELSTRGLSFLIWKMDIIIVLNS